VTRTWSVAVVRDWVPDPGRRWDARGV